ncbi:hypothetical protein FGO68_gene14895 [Halteria grandinella]|uniref:Uncharacterized protein n=1 Tax=Halteria grandinella TaxID=5974 RepID=A0A8J8NQH4_HALGN|nr:hypothetical protein FGO68_gene14895 [Halteria grandinella]
MYEYLGIICGVLGFFVLLGANVTLLTTSVIMIQSDAFNYGAVIQQESSDWGKGAITEITSSEEGCSEGEERVTGQFPGTRTYCTAFGVVYKKSCQEVNVKGTETPGLEAANLDTFFGTHFCIKRNANLTYHYLAQNRNISICPETFCGSTANAYCHNDTCPLNALYTDKSHFEWTSIDQELMQMQELLPDTANASNNPLVTIEFRLSRPCGRLRDSYVSRNKEIGEYYNVKQCNYYQNHSQEHELYYPSSFNLYYRPYSNWSPKCQAKYSTETIAAKSKLYSDFHQSSVLASKLLFGWIPFFFLVLLVLVRNTPCCNFFLPIILYFFSLVVIIFLGNSHRAYRDMDMDMHNWIVEQGDCSEKGLLQASFAQFVTDVKYYAAIFYTQLIIFYIMFGIKLLGLLGLGMLLLYWCIKGICEALREFIDEWRERRNYRPRTQRDQVDAKPVREQGKQWDKVMRYQHESRDLVQYQEKGEEDVMIEVQDIVI